MRYFSQFDYRDEDGIVFGNFQDRRSMRGNFEAFPLPNLSVGVNTSYTFSTIGQPQNDNNILGYLGNVLLLPVPYQFTDSLAVRSISTIYRTNQYLGSAEARYTPIQNLALRAQVDDVGQHRRCSGQTPGTRTGHAHRAGAVAAHEHGIEHAVHLGQQVFGGDQRRVHP